MFRKFVLILLNLCLAVPVSLPAFAAEKWKAEDVVARHLASIGTAEARAAAKTRVLTGTAEMREIVRGSSSLKGSSSLACDDRRVKIEMKFPGASQYPGEQWIFDGTRVGIAMTAPGARSAIGNFLFQYPELLKEGLLGGSLFTTWSLLDLNARQPRLKYDGLKKIDGRELHQVTYTPRKTSGIEIHLYFDKDTFRHVRTTYRLEVGAGMGATVAEHTDEVRYLLEENFDDFQTVDGLTLPTSWTIRYEVQPSDSAVLEWKIKAEKVKHNEPL